MRKLLGALCAAPILFAGVAHAQALWDNGPLVTHPGAGPGGVDVSMASVVPNSAGFNVTGTLWRADNFTVDGPGWLVSSIETFAYDTNNQPPRFGEATIRIHADDGGAPGAVVSSASATWGAAGINRVFNGVANLSNTARQLNLVSADFGDFPLLPGEYWISFDITNTAAANNWVPFVMDPNPADPNDPITRIGNSMFTTNQGDTWTQATVTTGDWNNTPEIPFFVNGELIPEPATLGLLGLAGLALVRRRR